MKLTVPNIVRMLWQAIQGWSKDEVPRLGASLAYYTLFSLAPMLVIAIGVAGLVWGPDAARGEIVYQIDELFGSDGARAVEEMLANAYRADSGIVAIVIGSVTFLLGATGAFMELQHALNTIFRVKQDPGSSLLGFIVDRARSFGLVLCIGFLLLVSLGVSAALAAASKWFEASAGGAPILWQVVSVVMSLGVITVLFALIYRFLPDVRLKWRDVWMGAGVTALLFTIGKQLIGLYLGHSTTASSYGAAGSVVVILVWVYYSSQIVLLGAEFTRVYTERQGKVPAPQAHAKHDPDARPSEN